MVKPRTTAVPAAFVTVAIIACVAGAKTSPQREAVQRQRKLAEASLQSLPLLEKTRVSDVFRLEAQGRSLALRSEPGTDDFGPHRAMLEGFATPAVVAFTRLLPDAQLQFEFTVEDYPDDDTSSRVHVMSRPHLLQIDRTVRSNRGFAG